MTEAEWKERWGILAPYNPTFGIPTLWRDLHTAGTPLGPALTDESTKDGVTIQYFALGLIRWSGPQHGPAWYATTKAVPLPREHVIPFPKAHLTNPQAQMDGAGVIFVATRLSSDIGGVVYRVDRAQLSKVLELGPVLAHANGELVVWPDGHCYYVTVDRDQTNIRIVPVPGWTRVT